MSFATIAIVGAGIGVAAGATKAISGASQVKKGKKALAAAKDPGFQVPEDYYTNLAQAEQMARRGLPAEQYNLAATNIQRGTQAELRQLGRMSNPFAGKSINPLHGKQALKYFVALLSGSSELLL